ncbi:MAG: glycosyl hydrolase family 18 protein [Verrucomicrobia bacterium]|nr:glycosyl hydrolase family 18 protein [Verrucomicrobiota bacterium]
MLTPESRPHFFLAPWRTIYGGAIFLAGLWVAWICYSPGRVVLDGRHDQGLNGLWVQHGWLGDDDWFGMQDGRVAKEDFHLEDNLDIFALKLHTNGIRYVFPHVCPCRSSGEIAEIDPEQGERFLDATTGHEVLPWIGGVFELHAWPDDPEWRATFVESATHLIAAHPRFAGLHVNIEPMPDGNDDFVQLLRELRTALPGKKLSIAAYPPPTAFQRVPDVHWSEGYIREIAETVDQMVFMMYDTALQHEKLYIGLMKSWTEECLNWTTNTETEVLLGLPAYDDSDSGYHHPRVENLSTGLAGIHAGLSDYETLPVHYAGAAIYSEWEMDPAEWKEWRTGFLREVAQ